MAETTIKPFNLSIAKSIIGPLAQTNHFLVTFSSLTPAVESYLANYTGIRNIKSFLSRQLGILCSDAVLPGSALASLDTRGDYQGVIERMAHTRNFTQINLEFYVDNEYKSMKFLEHWMEYITGAISNLLMMHTFINFIIQVSISQMIHG